MTDLEIECFGASSVKTQGIIKQCTIDCSGTSRAHVSVVTDSLKGDSSGVSRIVCGVRKDTKVRERKSGMASIDIQRV